MEASSRNKLTRCGHGYDRSLYIYAVTSFVNDIKRTHYHAIKNVQAVFNRSTFCQLCMAPHKPDKACPHKCFLCSTKECKTRVSEVLVCQNCAIQFPNRECYNDHLKASVKGTRCSRYFKCLTCDMTGYRLNRDGTPHRCYTTRCPRCLKLVTADHLCFNRNADPENTEKFKYIFFYFEARQDDKFSCPSGYNPKNHDLNCGTCSDFTSLCLNCRRCANCNNSKCGADVHVVNYVNIQTVCEMCVHDPASISTSVCKQCGDQCVQCRDKSGNSCDSTCGRREIIFSGEATIAKFCDWVFTKHHQGARLFSHNGKGYDHHFILNYMMSRGEPLSVIYNGSKIISMRKDQITFIDSSNFFMMPLSALPKAFGLTEDKTKLAFPHFFNTAANQAYRGPFPDPVYYGCEDFSEAKKETFLK